MHEFWAYRCFREVDSCFQHLLECLPKYLRQPRRVLLKQYVEGLPPGWCREMSDNEAGCRKRGDSEYVLLGCWLVWWPSICAYHSYDIMLTKS